MSTTTSEILSVSQLTQQIKAQLEGNFAFVSVEGEISNFKQQASGHLYFTLKDQASQISAVLFQGNTRNLSRMPREGDKVVAKGEISVYAPRGNYQLLIRSLQFSGVGELLLLLHERKRRLQTLGWFDLAHKKPLPKLPKTIGVVTSSTGAVIQDILNVLTRRHGNFHLILSAVRVQGAEAAAEIASAINQFNRYKLADVLIVGRGGGSLEDLLPFSEEIVAEAIYNSDIPIISAVGHETDYSIADFVADKRAPTPSAAAEIVTLEKEKELEQLRSLQRRAMQLMRQLLTSRKEALQRAKNHPLLLSKERLLAPFYQRIDLMPEELTKSLARAIRQERLKLEHKKLLLSQLKPQAKIAESKKALTATSGQIQALFKAHVSRAKERLNALSSHLQAIDPKNLLTKGYGIIFREKDNSVILSVNAVQEAERLSILLGDGTLQTQVISKQPKNP